MANGAIPGDMLYGMKLGFNERVSAALAGGSRSKVEWQIDAAERRLNEAAQASLQGQLNAGTEEVVLANFNAQLKAIDEYITTARAEGRIDEAKEIAIKIGQALANQTQNLMFAQAEAKANVENTEGQGALDFLVLKVSSTLAAAANIAASTLIEDPAPNTDDLPPTDEWGRPLKVEASATGTIKVGN